MRIEQGFRDGKTHLGVRGLKLESNRAVRLGRLLRIIAALTRGACAYQDELLLETAE